jgi:tetratricopeptide (TPR) repeat protein
MGDRLRAAWNFEDLDATEQRFRALLEHEPTDAGRAELLTQLARLQGLREQFEDAERLVDEAAALAGSSVAARTRVQLERGRIGRSSGDPSASLPLFESAYRIALTGGEHWLAADAAHMAALVAPDRPGRLAWTERGLDLARDSPDPDVSYWLGPLLNNLGWEHYAAGEHESALDAFQQALHARERRPAERAKIEIARYAVGKTLRALGRADEAAAVLEKAVAWTRTVGKPDGWFHEELALACADLGREAEAREHARLALALLPDIDASFEGDAARADRLESLA